MLLGLETCKHWIVFVLSGLISCEGSLAHLKDRDCVGLIIVSLAPNRVPDTWKEVQ